jgi:uncharacterized protein (TIGR03084 family)
MREDADPLVELIQDFADERQGLEGVLTRLPDAVWDASSPAKGWTLRDCVAHLAESDERAAAATEGLDPSKLQRKRPAGPLLEGTVLSSGQQWAREQPVAAVLAWWQGQGERLIAGMRLYKANDRLLWAGRQMSARSFLTARLMEHWSHGLDILETAHVEAVDTDRLRHIAHLGFITRDFAYRTRGLEPPVQPLYVELTLPSGGGLVFGPPDARDKIHGPAGDFCRVVTQRIHWSDTGLQAEGELAKEFLVVAQAFAGPPGEGRPPRGPRLESRSS